MKRTIAGITLTMAALAIPGGAFADHGVGFVDTARVISAEPVYETVRVARPVEECWTERVVYQDGHRHSYTGTIAGGIIGGVVGNQFGRGRGKTAMTVAGTLLGASIGRDVSSRSPPSYTAGRVNRCEVVERYEEQEQLAGYRVKYRYKGEIFVTHTDEHPGKYIRVSVNVSPVDHL
jgi:uncharacterized protein YcfJ